MCTLPSVSHGSPFPPRPPVLQEVDRVRQHCAHEGIHRDESAYHTKMMAAHKTMPLHVSDLGRGFQAGLSWLFAPSGSG